MTLSASASGSLTSPTMLFEVASRVLEQTFRVGIETMTSGEHCLLPGWQASIRFQGPEAGRVGICVSSAHGKEIAMAFLQDGKEPTEASVKDAVGEIANILSSSVVAFLYGGHREVTIGTPLVLPQLESSGPQADVSAELWVEKRHVVQVWLALD